MLHLFIACKVKGFWRNDQIIMLFSFVDTLVIKCLISVIPLSKYAKTVAKLAKIKKNVILSEVDRKFFIFLQKVNCSHEGFALCAADANI